MPSITALPFGAPAEAELRRLIAAAQATDRLAPVTVVVPSTYAALSLRARLAPDGLVNVRFDVPQRLASLLISAAPEGANRSPLTPWRRAEAIRAALATVRPQTFKDVATHPATRRALEATFRDLRTAPESTLAQLAASDSLRSRDLAALYDAFRTFTASETDLEDVAQLATAALAANPPALRDIGRVIVYLPRSLSPAYAALVRALMDRGTADVVLGLAGEDAADAETIALAASLGVTASPSAAGPAHGTHIVRAIDVEEEVRTVIRLILAGAQEQQTPLHRVGVLYSSANLYGPLIQEQFKAACIPIHGPAIHSLADSMPGRVLLGLLALPRSGFRRTAVMEWLTSGPILQFEDQPARVPAHDWDKVTRDAGIVKGLASWRSRLRAWSRYDRNDTRVAEALETFINELEANLTPPADNDMPAFGKWALGLLTRYLGPEERGTDVPDKATADYTRLRKALEVIVSTPPLVEPSATPPSEDPLTLFIAALEDTLQRPAGSLGKFGDGVFVGSTASARGMSFDALYILGMTEGAMPASGHEDPLLNDVERGSFGLPRRSERRIAARADYLAALATAPRRVLCFARSNLRAQTRHLPSRWLLETASHLEEREITAEDFETLQGRPWLTAVSSFESALKSRALEPASLQEHDLQSLLAVGDPRRHELAEELAYTAGLQASLVRLPAWARRFPLDTRTLSPWAGAASGAAIPAGTAFSPTPFETLAQCPFRYFLKHVLSVPETELPEDNQQISAAERGNIIHKALERFLTTVHDRGESPAPDEDWQPHHLEELLAITREECDRAEAQGITGSPLLWRVDRARILNDVKTFLEKDNEARRARRSSFVEAEHDFGGRPRNGEHVRPALALDLGNGRTITFRGKIDRVDRTADGTLVVYDYKSGSSYKYNPIEKGPDPLVAGKFLQLPIYGLAARQNLGEPTTPVYSAYWFVGSRGAFKQIGYPLSPTEELRLREVLNILVDTVEAGLFPAVPGKWQNGAYENCRYCPFDKVCPSGDRVRSWEEWSADPGLSDFIALSSPASTATTSEEDADA